MRIIIAGAWQWPWYEEACAEALRMMGHEVRRFSWEERFADFIPERVEPIPKSIIKTIQRRFNIGPIISSINYDLMKAVDKFRPHILLAYRATHIFPHTLCAIKNISPATMMVQYCNDDPFSPKAGKLLWRHLKKAVPVYDIHFVYRHKNIDEFLKHGATRVELLRSYYIADRNFPVKLQTEDKRFVCDVVFAGHYEPDFRSEYLEAVISAGYKLNLFGGGWNYSSTAIKQNSSLRGLFPIRPVLGEDYRKAISGSKIALCFLSKLNRDTYTRRNFEIPATGAFMLSEYSEDLASLFEEGKEAEFFRTKKEFMDKIKYFIKHDNERDVIARRGYERVLRDGHDVVSRMDKMMGIVKNYL